jgi:hypothetical protein
MNPIDMAQKNAPIKRTQVSGEFQRLFWQEIMKNNFSFTLSPVLDDTDSDGLIFKAKKEDNLSSQLFKQYFIGNIIEAQALDIEPENNKLNL